MLPGPGLGPDLILQEETIIDKYRDGTVTALNFVNFPIGSGPVKGVISDLHSIANLSGTSEFQRARTSTNSD